MNILIPSAAIAVLGLLFGLLLGYAAKKFAVETDPRFDAVRELLPGANCGGCGNASCDAYADRLVKGLSGLNECAVINNENRQKIGEVLGIVSESQERKVPAVLCQGCEQNCPSRYEYKGYNSCRAAAMVSGGPKGCQQSCIGLGDCVTACTFGGIKIVDGLPMIDERLCHSCGACASACPRGVISMLSYKPVARIHCRTALVARDARSVCKTACLKCRLCERTCPVKAISVQDNGRLAVDESICTGCGLCAEKCPTKAIKLVREPEV